MEVVKASDYEGFSHGFDGMEDCIRIFPHKMQGEGHFLTLLHKKGEGRKNVWNPPAGNKVKLAGELEAFLEQIFMPVDISRIQMVDERAYLLPEGLAGYQKLHILRAGLLLGEVRKNRFEPSQALAMALKKEEFAQTIDFSSNDINVIKYLKGETLEIGEDFGASQGFNLVCTDGFPLGWGKLTGTTLKNKYHAGWRWQ